jgi:talin
LVKAAGAFNPGKVQLDATAETLQAAVGELDSAAIQLAIGKIESPVAATKTHKDWQDTLVAISRDFVGCTSSLVEATRADAATLKRVAAEINKHVPSLVSATKAAAATSSDPALQKNLLSNAKDLSSSLLGLVRAAKDANAQNRQSQQVLVERSKKCSQAIGKFVSLLKANAVIYQELEEAAKQIMGLVGQLDAPATASGRAYNEIRESLQQTILSIAEKASAINSADKANLGQMGLQARQLCDILPKFVAQIRDAAATTADPTARADIAGSSKALINAIANLVNAAKTADPKNPATEQAITSAFDQSSQVSAAVLKALKSGATGEMLIEQAIERAKDAVVTLNRNTIFAQAGQLEPAPDMATVSVTAARAQLATLAKNIATQAAQMAEATRRNQEQFGAAARELAETVHIASTYTVKAATKLPDNVSQQNLLTAAKAAAIASQQLIMTGRETQRNANPTTLQQLTQSVDTTRTCIDQLLQVSENASAEAARGEKGLEDAKIAVQAAMDGFEAFQGAQAEDVIRAAKDITHAVSELVFAQNQEAATIAAGQLVEANKTLLATSRGASALTTDPAVKKALVGSSTNVAGASIQLLESCKLNREDEQAQNKIFECSSSVTAALSELVKAINQLPNAKNLSVDELSANKGAEADDEMDKTAKLILDAAKQLDASRAEIANRKANARNTTSSQAELDRLLRQGEIAEAILAAARAITQATAQLVSCAAVCQKERKSEAGPAGQRYRNDPTWNNGLISAARAVSDAVVFLVRTANTVLDNKQDEDALVVAAKGIATSTAQLVTASKVRGPAANSKSQTDLSAAAKAVAQATNQLLVATRNASDATADDDVTEPGNYNPLGGKVKEFEEQMRILKLERELLAARKNLGDMRKAQYKQ